MTTIKGPIKFSKGFDAAKFIEEKATEIKVALPFTATGWKSTKTPEIADMTNVKSG